MAVGDVHIEPSQEYADPVTGRPVRRLTGLDTHCHHPYFYCRAFTPDGARVLYASSRTGRRCAYLLELATGRSVQLTDEPDLHDFLMTLSHDGRFLYYPAGQALRRLELETGRNDLVYEQPAPWTGGAVYPGYSDDFTLALLCQMHADDVVHGKEGWDFFEPQWRRRPRCRLVLLDLRTGRDKVVLEEACWLGHPQIRPRDPGTLLYCHEGPSHLLDARIWRIAPDGTGKRWLVCHEPSSGVGAGEIVTHEYFTPDGRYIAYTYYPLTYGVDGHVRMLEVDRDRSVDLGPVHNYSHPYHSPDCRWVVGDECKKTHLQRNCIWLLDIETRTQKRLCLHGSSFAPRGTSTQDAHPHPSFSPDGRQVLFTTDRETGPTGNCSVYLAPTDGMF